MEASLEGHGQIEAGAFLLYIGGGESEVNGDVGGGAECTITLSPHAGFSLGW